MSYLSSAFSLLTSAVDSGSITLLHASLYPLATYFSEHPGRVDIHSKPEFSSLCASVILRCLSSPSSSNETVTLCMLGLCFHRLGGGDTAGALVSALGGRVASSVVEGCPGESHVSNLSAAVSSGFLGLFNALSSAAEGDNVACLSSALREEVSVIPMALTALASAAVDLLLDCFEECERVKEASDGMEKEGLAVDLPSPLRLRAAETIRVLYASDARVAVEIALRAVGDNSPSAVDPWLRLLFALKQYACPEYRREEVEKVLLTKSDI